MAGSHTMESPVDFVWRVRLEESAEGCTVKRSRLEVHHDAHSRAQESTCFEHDEHQGEKVSVQAICAFVFRAGAFVFRGVAFVFRAEAERIGRNSQHWPVTRRGQKPW